MIEEQENKFWERVAKATTPRRSLARWKQSRDAVHERVHPHRPGSRLKWIFIAAPAFAAAALFFYKAQTPPPPVVVSAPEVEAVLVAEAEARPEVDVEAEAEEWNVRATAVTGDILLTSKDGVPTLLETGVPLEAGDALDVPADGSLEIAFAVDSVMQFGPGSRLTIGSLQRKDSVFELAYGSLVAKLNWAKRRGYALRVRSPAAVAAVRGTEFAMEVAENGDTDIGVFDEGKIAVSDRARPAEAETMLAPNQEIRFGPAEKRGARPAVRALKRLAHHREGVRHMNRRQAQLRQFWKDMPPAQRRARREKMRERLESNPQFKERLLKRIKRQKERQGRQEQVERPRQRLQQQRQEERPRPRQRLKQQGEEERRRPAERQQGQRPLQKLQEIRKKQQRQRPRQENKRPGGKQRRRDGGRRPNRR